jgi:hypothetical protein
VLGDTDWGWIVFEFTTEQGSLWLAAVSDQGTWCLYRDHSGSVKELALPSFIAYRQGHPRLHPAYLLEDS